jgi:CheY-like chemotaxis protein
MESVGRLAGGVAHDFNNLLMGIMGYAELCQGKIAQDHPIREWLDEIIKSAHRSASLTQQLLAFARRQPAASKVIELNAPIESMLPLLRRLIGECIAIHWRPGSGIWPVKMDPSQIDPVLTNLAVNARDAIGGVGSITMETGRATLSSAYCSEHLGAHPGDYTVFTIADDGCGMDRETLAHIFEPFYSTKGVGRGSGMGLAIVYGIVSQNGGFIDVESELGKGTTFRIYLPRVVTPVTVPVASEISFPTPHGNETILLVDDEKSVRVTTFIFLEDLGYTVLVAEAPEEALRLAAGYHGIIHLLVTDVVMPGLSGYDLAIRLAELRPNIKCLFISGFAADFIPHVRILDTDMNFLAKPFQRDVLARKVREVLGGPEKGRTGAM